MDGSVQMLRRLAEKVRRANSIQHSGGRVSAEDWSELHQLTNEAFGLIDAAEATSVATDPDGDRLFIGCLGVGISYADRHREKHGDYARLAFLSLGTLELTVEDDCPAELRAEIESHAATIQAKRGEQYQVSTSGQTVTLGFACAPPAPRMKP